MLNDEPQLIVKREEGMGLKENLTGGRMIKKKQKKKE